MGGKKRQRNRERENKREVEDNHAHFKAEGNQCKAN